MESRQSREPQGDTVYQTKANLRANVQRIALPSEIKAKPREQSFKCMVLNVDRERQYINE